MSKRLCLRRQEEEELLFAFRRMTDEDRRMLLGFAKDSAAENPAPRLDVEEV